MNDMRRTRHNSTLKSIPSIRNDYYMAPFSLVLVLRYVIVCMTTKILLLLLLPVIVPYTTSYQLTAPITLRTNVHCRSYDNKNTCQQQLSTMITKRNSAKSSLVLLQLQIPSSSSTTTAPTTKALMKNKKKTETRFVPKRLEETSKALKNNNKTSSTSYSISNPHSISNGPSMNMIMSFLGTMFTLFILYTLANDGSYNSEIEYVNEQQQQQLYTQGNNMIQAITTTATEQSPAEVAVLDSSSNKITSILQSFWSSYRRLFIQSQQQTTIPQPQQIIESMEMISTNIVDAAIPLSASDFVSVSIGESIAGVVGTSISYILSNLFIQNIQSNSNNNKNNPQQEQFEQKLKSKQLTNKSSFDYNNLFPMNGYSSYNNNNNNANIMNMNNNIVKMSDAMADTDYIITNSAVKELLISSSSYIPISPLVRTIIATVIAIIPYSIVKINAQKQQQKDMMKNQLLLQQLLYEEELIQQQRKQFIQLGTIWKQIQTFIPSKTTTTTTKSSSMLVPINDSTLTTTSRNNNNNNLFNLNFDTSNTYSVQSPKVFKQQQLGLDGQQSSSTSSTSTTSTTTPSLSNVQFDWVELFADIVKWLQFDVLYTDFGNGQLLASSLYYRHVVYDIFHIVSNEEQYVSLLIGTECALFGIITALTSQIYADILYIYFNLGTTAKQIMIKNRTLYDWYMIYISKMIYCGVLFGIYGALKEPTESIVMAIGSGGIDNCYGSNNYQSCVDTFIINNPIGPTPEAQVRAIVTAIVSFWNNHNSWFTM